MKELEQARTASIINLLAGIWLLIAPTILRYIGSKPQTNDVWVGLVVGVLALIRLTSPARVAWLSWINILLGIWLIIAPFVIGYATITPRWNDIILGIIVGIMAIWSSVSTSHSHTHSHHGGTAAA